MIWVKRFGLFLGILSAWIVLTFLFVSKERLCNAAIDMAASRQVTLCYEARETTPIGCRLEKTTLLYGHSPVATIAQSAFLPWKISLSDIRLQGIAASFVPEKIHTVRIEPLSGRLYAEGDFGILHGEIAWSRRQLTLELQPSSLMRRNFGSSLRAFERKNGKYLYVASF